MPESSKVILNDSDNSDQIVGANLGLVGFSGLTRRGPVNRPDIIITTLAMFRQIYGPSAVNTDFAFQCERVLKSGGQLRINGIKHYTTISDKTTLTALYAAPASDIKDTALSNPVNLFSAQSKYPGADYNNVKLIISAATNGKSNYFNLTVLLTGDEANATETYKNLSVTNTNVANSTYLDEVNQASNLVVLTYLDLSGYVDTLYPAQGTTPFIGGSDGGGVIDADYVGDVVAKTGLYALDQFDDMTDVAVPVISTSAVNIALANYAAGRGDLQALVHLSHNNVTAAEYITARGNTDTKYQGIFAGSISSTDPGTGVVTQFSEIADIVIINNYVDKAFAPWISRANFVRGSISNATGVVNNFGSPGNANDLELLAANQINMVIAANRKVYLKGNFSGQLEASKASYFNIVRGLVYVKKTLKPTLEEYLEEPADIPTFIKLFKEVEPFLDSLTTGRFLYKGAGVSGKGYDWQGDQDATDINHLQYNTPTELDKGNYNVNLLLYPINSIQVLTLNISLNSLAGAVSITF